MKPPCSKCEWIVDLPGHCTWIPGVYLYGAGREQCCARRLQDKGFDSVTGAWRGLRAMSCPHARHEDSCRPLDRQSRTLLRRAWEWIFGRQPEGWEEIKAAVKANSHESTYALQEDVGYE